MGRALCRRIHERLPVLNVIQSHAKELLNVTILQNIEDLSPLLSAAYEPHLSQPPQLMRDSRLTHAQSPRQRPNTHFVLQER
jgi:hypothetical protein